MKEDFSDDTELIEALRSGQPKAFRFLINTYHKKLCTYAYTLCKSEDQAEDIVQNVFLKLWKKRHKLQNIRRLSSFLYKSVYNEFIDQYRQSKKVMSLEKKHIETLSLVLEEESDEIMDQLIKTIGKEIDNLPKKCKKTFLLSTKEGLTNLEISEYLDVSIKTVEAHMTKAYKILRAKIKK